MENKCLYCENETKTANNKFCSKKCYKNYQILNKLNFYNSEFQKLNSSKVKKSSKSKGGKKSCYLTHEKCKQNKTGFWNHETQKKNGINGGLNSSGFKNKKHTIKAIQKMKAAREKQICPTIDTSIELKLQNFLKKLGISFFTHQYMKIEHGYQCDIFIPQYNMIIECDGKYFHKYPFGKETDLIRNEELRAKGFIVLRFWEQEINNITLEEFKFKLDSIINYNNIIKQKEVII